VAAVSGRSVRVRPRRAAALAAWLTAGGATVAGHDGDMLTVTGTTAEAIGEAARASGLTLTELAARQATLEERYMELTQDRADYQAQPLAEAGEGSRCRSPHPPPRPH